MKVYERIQTPIVRTSDVLLLRMSTPNVQSLHEERWGEACGRTSTTGLTYIGADQVNLSNRNSTTAATTTIANLLTRRRTYEQSAATRLDVLTSSPSKSALPHTNPKNKEVKKKPQTGQLRRKPLLRKVEGLEAVRECRQ
jgi:hypothetical protein